MRFYTRQRRRYCGIDLHARSLYLCVLDRSGKTVAHQKLACDRDELLRVLKPYRKDLVVALECLFCWYWGADLRKPRRWLSLDRCLVQTVSAPSWKPSRGSIFVVSRSSLRVVD